MIQVSDKHTMDIMEATIYLLRRVRNVVDNGKMTQDELTDKSCDFVAKLMNLIKTEGLVDGLD